MKFPSKTSVLAEVRRSMGDTFNPEWVEAALTAAAAVPPNDDFDVYMTTVYTAATVVLKARIAVIDAENKALNRQTDERASTWAASRAAWAAEDAFKEMPVSDTVQ